MTNSGAGDLSCPPAWREQTLGFTGDFSIHHRIAEAPHISRMICFSAVRPLQVSSPVKPGDDNPPVRLTPSPE